MFRTTLSLVQCRHSMRRAFQVCHFIITSNFLGNILKECSSVGFGGLNTIPAQGSWPIVLSSIGRDPAMAATDVASRGVDVNDIKTVINYNFPNNTEDYVHFHFDDFSTSEEAARGQSSRHVWKARSPMSATSLFEYLKDAPTMKPWSLYKITPIRIPPTERTSPPTVSHGGDTPISMVVGRASEPSLTSYPPTSSICVASKADCNELPGLNLTSGHPMSKSVRTVQSSLVNASMTKSIATFIAMDSSQGTVVGNPVWSNSEEYIVVSPSENAGMGEWTFVADVGKSEGSTSSAPAVGKLLGRGRIDAKAQDDFIAIKKKCC
jgi:hypothetical protein